MPNENEFQEGLNNLKDKKIDYIITHTCPSDEVRELANPSIYDQLTDYLNDIQKTISYKHWYFGHFHINFLNIKNNISALYDIVIPINKIR